MEDKATRVKIYQGDWDEDIYNRSRYFPPGALGHSAANWIKFSPERLYLGPQKTEEVRVEVNVPEDNKPSGSYWSMLFVEEEPTVTKMESGQTGVNIILRYGITVFVTFKDTEIIDGAITNMKILTAEEDKFFFEITFENRGNILLHPKGYLEIRDEEGETIKKINVNQFSILPGHSEISKVFAEKPKNVGQYTGLAVLHFGGDYLVAGELVFKVVAK